MDPSDRDRPILATLIIMTFPATVDAPVFDHDCVDIDDPVYVTDNPHVTAGLDVEIHGVALGALRAASGD